MEPSHEEPLSDDTPETVEQHFVLYFISADDVPPEVGHTIYLSAFLSNGLKDSYDEASCPPEIYGQPVHSLRRSYCKSIVWNTFRNFGVKPPPSSYLTLEILDSESDKESVGFARVDIDRDLADEEPKRIYFEHRKSATEKKYPRFSIVLQRKFLNSPPPSMVTFFMIRHGESKWNKAQQDGNITGLFNLDHALTIKGIQQALDLRKEWQEFEKDRCGEDEVVAVAIPTSAIKINDAREINSYSSRKDSISNDQSNGTSPQQSSLNSPSLDVNNYSSQDISKIDSEFTLPEATDGIAFESTLATEPPVGDVSAAVDNHETDTVVNDLIDLSFDSSAPAITANFPENAFESVVLEANMSSATADGLVTVTESNPEPLLDITGLETTGEKEAASSLFLGSTDNFSHIGSMITSFSTPSSANYEYAAPVSASEEQVTLSTSPTAEVTQPATNPLSTSPGSAVENRKMSRSATMTSEGTIDGFLKLSRTGTMTSDYGASSDVNDHQDGPLGSLNLSTVEQADANEDESSSEDSDSEDDIDPVPEKELEVTENLTRLSMRVAQKMHIRGFNLNDLRERMLNYRMQFVKSSRIYSSPFTRAIETTLVALNNHRAMIHGVTLVSCIREIKGVGGLDSVGVAFGDDIGEKVSAELEGKLGKVQAQELLPTPDLIYPNDASSQWWTSMSSFDSKDDQKDRVNEFLSFVRYCGDENPIFVGHSLFFKLFYSRRISPFLLNGRPDLANNMRKYKLKNTTVLAVTVVFGEDHIYDAEVIFGEMGGTAMGFQVTEDVEDTSEHSPRSGARKTISESNKPPRPKKSRFGISSFTGQISGIKSSVSGIKSMASSVVNKVFGNDT